METEGNKQKRTGISRWVQRSQRAVYQVRKEIYTWVTVLMEWNPNNVWFEGALCVSTSVHNGLIISLLHEPQWNSSQY